MEMGLFLPNIPRRALPALLKTALSGMVVGGVYGVIHDLITFALSNEYYTKVKFDQFAWADIGLPPILHAAEVGLIAGGAAGLVLGWFLARAALGRSGGELPVSRLVRGFALVLLSAAVTAVLASAISPHRGGDCSRWKEFCLVLGIVDVPAFVHVAYIHYGSYLGAFVGLVLAILHLRHGGNTDAGTHGQTQTDTDKHGRNTDAFGRGE